MHRSHEDRYTLITPKLYILRRAIQLAGDYPPGDPFTAIDLDAPPDVRSSVPLAILLCLATISTIMMGSREQHSAAD